MHSTCVSDNRKRFYCHFCHFGFFLFMTSQALELHPFLTKVILFFILDFHKIRRLGRSLRLEKPKICVFKGFIGLIMIKLYKMFHFGTFYTMMDNKVKYLILSWSQALETLNSKMNPF